MSKSKVGWPLARTIRWIWSNDRTRCNV